MAKTTLDTSVGVGNKNPIDPEKAHVTLMLNSIYHTWMDMTPRQITSYFSSNLGDTKMVRDYLNRAEEVGYDDSKLKFLVAINDTCLQSSI